MSNRQILDEAGAWFVDFRTGGVDKSVRRKFMRWLRRSPEHIRAYMEISGAYARLPVSASMPARDIVSFIERTRSRINVVSMDSAGKVPLTLPGLHSGSAAHHGSWKRVLLAASVAVLLISAALTGWLVSNRAPVYATQAGEQRAILLDDGSRIDLNVHTRVRVDFTSTQRSVELLQGQALFQVAKDEHRPFIVTSDAARIRAIGTRFDVYRKQVGSTTVSVLEGRVAVDANAREQGAHAQPSVLELSAGEQTVITATTVARPKRANVSATTAWVQGELEFDETRFADVAEEFNRYAYRSLVIDTPQLAEFRITGVYASADPASLIRFLRNQPDFIVKETSAEIRVSRK